MSHCSYTFEVSIVLFWIAEEENPTPVLFHFLDQPHIVTKVDNFTLYNFFDHIFSMNEVVFYNGSCILKDKSAY